MQYPIIQKFISKNRPGTPLLSRGGVIHETANSNDSDEMEQNYFDKNDVQASAHAFIDADSITQCIPWNEVAWHAGRTANRQFWGIEMCHTKDPIKFIEIWNRAVWLFANLFTQEAYPKIYSVSPTNLMSHAEVSKAWKETDHMDPVEYFKFHNKTVDMFRRDVQVAINDMLFNRAVKCSKIIKSPEYWIENCQPGRNINGAYAHQVILNFVAMFKICNSFEECIDWMISKKIINKPEPNTIDWKVSAMEGKTIAGANMRWMLIAIGKIL